MLVAVKISPDCFMEKKTSCVCQIVAKEIGHFHKNEITKFKSSVNQSLCVNYFWVLIFLIFSMFFPFKPFQGLGGPTKHILILILMLL